MENVIGISVNQFWNFLSVYKKSQYKSDTHKRFHVRLFCADPLARLGCCFRCVVNRVRVWGIVLQPLLCKTKTKFVVVVESVVAPSFRCFVTGLRFGHRLSQTLSTGHALSKQEKEYVSLSHTREKRSNSKISVNNHDFRVFAIILLSGF